VVAELFADGGGISDLPEAFVEALFASAGVGDERGLIALADRIAPLPGSEPARWRMAALGALLDAARREGATLAQRLRASEDGRRAWAACEPLLAAARGWAASDARSIEDRLAAVALVGRLGVEMPEADRDQLAALLVPQTPAALQEAAVAALGRTRGARVPELLVRGWKTQTPAVREVVLETLLSRPEWVGSLLSSLEDGCVPPAELSARTRQRLIEQSEAALQERARVVLAAVTTSRQAVLDRYRPALGEPGEAGRGAAVFRKQCATCHRFQGEGTEVGPDLAALNDRSPEALLIAILDPNRSVEAKFHSYTVATRDGRVVEGLIAAETPSGITLRRTEGREESLLRAEIEELVGSGRSLMPEGLEQDLTPRDVADLVAYLNAAAREPAPPQSASPAGPDGERR
jgi:putative heme-binding domain-containing protein